MRVKRLALKFAALALALGLLGACPSLSTQLTQVTGQVPANFKARNAVILVIDGPRQSEMWADKSRQHIPRMAGELAPQGVLLSGFQNNGPTYTNAGHCALTTGHYEELENSKGNELPRRPSIFQHFRRARGLPASSAAIIASKDKLHILGNSADPTWTNSNQPLVWAGRGGKGFGAGYGDDADTMAALRVILARDHPRLVLINLKEPDSSGHKGDWSAYLKGLRQSDQYAVEIWNFLQADDFYANKTAFFITHDHGRHLEGVRNGFVDHGCSCAGCRGVALLALGPDFRKGVELKKGGELIDVPVTIAKMLGLQIPGLKGRVLSELF